MNRWMIGCVAALSIATGCAAAPMRAEMPPMAIAEQAPQILDTNHFQQDRTGNLSETGLREILDAPVFLEDDTRVGIVPVTTAYDVDEELPLATVPHALSDAMEKTGFFEVTTEVSTDWPADGSVAGLRELAARYRSKYLLLYRHRFVDDSRLNAWAWTYPTIVGIFAAPAQTVEVAGVLEATLFDVRTGTILFTVYERVHDEQDLNIWNNDHKRREIKEQLLSKASGNLSASVTSKIRRLVAARPQQQPKQVASGL